MIREGQKSVWGNDVERVKLYYLDGRIRRVTSGKGQYRTHALDNGIMAGYSNSIA